MLLRLLVAAVLLGATQTYAQVQAGDPSNAFPTIDQYGTDPLFNFDSVDQSNGSPDSPVKAQSESRTERLSLLDTERNGPQFVPGVPLQADATCFAIRSYRVVRDDPHSDSIHRDGYTSCVPAARFRVYTTEQRR